MRPFDAHDLTLPPEAVANGVYPFDAQLSEARRYLASRGITEVRARSAAARYGARADRRPEVAELLRDRHARRQLLRRGRAVRGRHDPAGTVVETARIEPHLLSEHTFVLGRFRFARGEVMQTRVGRNTTPLRSFSERGDVLSPNYRFEFVLRLG